MTCSNCDEYYPEFCRTCKDPYSKEEYSFCSDAFHCCRDCKWDNGRIAKHCWMHQQLEYLGMACRIINTVENDRGLPPSVKVECDALKKARLLE